MATIADAGDVLFVELRRAWRCEHETEPSARDAAQSVAVDVEDAALQVELLRWWRSSMELVTQGNDVVASRASHRLEKRDYELLYARLDSALRRVSSPDAAAVPSDAQAVAAMMAMDWERDNREVITQELFARSMVAIASAKIATPSAATVTALLQDLHELAFGIMQATPRSVSATPDATPETPEQGAPSGKTPETMAEKLARMRTRRSTLTASMAAPANTSTSGNGDNDSGGSGRRASSEPNSLESPALSESATPASSHDSLQDDASHYFAIETRLELRERLSVLQTRLDALLLQTKLAWMKCFASYSGEDSDDNGDDDTVDRTLPTPAATTSIDRATLIVSRGETLTEQLQDAFTMARTTCPINEYKDLVATVEAEFDAFQALVLDLAAHSPSKRKVQPRRGSETDADVPTALSTHDGARSQPIQRPPLEFDLPSMKAYYAKAAPSYASYLPHGSSTRVTKGNR